MMVGAGCWRCRLHAAAVSHTRTAGGERKPSKRRLCGLAFDAAAKLL